MAIVTIRLHRQQETRNLIKNIRRQVFRVRQQLKKTDHRTDTGM